MIGNHGERKEQIMQIMKDLYIDPRRCEDFWVYFFDNCVEVDGRLDYDDLIALAEVLKRLKK